MYKGDAVFVHGRFFKKEKNGEEFNYGAFIAPVQNDAVRIVLDTGHLIVRMKCLSAHRIVMDDSEYAARKLAPIIRDSLSPIRFRSLFDFDSASHQVYQRYGKDTVFCPVSIKMLFSPKLSSAIGTAQFVRADISYVRKVTEVQSLTVPVLIFLLIAVAVWIVQGAAHAIGVVQFDRLRYCTWYDVGTWLIDIVTRVIVGIIVAFEWFAGLKFFARAVVLIAAALLVASSIWLWLHCRR